MAEADPPLLGRSTSGLRGLIYTGLPLSAPELNLSVAAGYGFTETIEPVDGAHHRAQAGLGVSLAPLPWLAFALRFDGRLEFHPDDGDGAHAAAFGDPRLFARVGHALGRATSIGFEASVWFPGTEAPSIVPEATSVDGRVLFALTPPSSPWALLAAAGFRLDNSSKSSPDLDRLRFGDRLSLGLSASNAVLAALGGAYRFNREVEVFVEASADLLVGSDAPELGESPLRAAGGGRYFMSRSLQLELSVIGSLSKRPAAGPDDPLVPIEPRISALFGLRLGFDLAGERGEYTPPKPVAPAKPATPASAPVEPPKPQFAEVTGVLVDDRGEPLPEGRVSLMRPGEPPLETISDGQGAYWFAKVPVGPAVLEVKATGFQTLVWEVEVQTGMAPEASRALVPKADIGILRGLIRTFASEPLRAEIAVRGRRGKNVATVESAEDGRFDLELPPGNYSVTIKASGYRPHTRKIKIQGNGVSILNVDMREKK